jgi:major type 1 subunit fimbrin (pilin)
LRVDVRVEKSKYRGGMGDTILFSIFFDLYSHMKNHIFVSTSTLAVGAALIIMSGHAFASDGTISFTGSVDASTCTIATSGVAGSFTIPLPKVSVQALKAAGNTAGDTPFEIRLTGCSDVTGNIATNFEAGTAVDLASGRLNNTTVGGAGKVQIQLLNAGNGSAILVGNPMASQNSVGAALTGSGSAGTATLRYFARYYATGVATSGAVASQVTYSLVFP